MIPQKTLEELLKRVEKPGRYIGHEKNCVYKNIEDVKVRFGFAFPDTYEIGMSYMGMQILYNVLNEQKDIYCERIFAPNADMEELMRVEGVPLFTIETKTPAGELDVIGFTLQDELSYTNILNILELAGIPLLRPERGEDEPLVVSGGPCAYNPEPLADIIDLFMVGDGEETIVEVSKLYIEAKETGMSKEEYLRKACAIEGVYVPAFYDFVYNEGGTIKEINKLYDGAPDRV